MICPRCQKELFENEIHLCIPRIIGLGSCVLNFLLGKKYPRGMPDGTWTKAKSSLNAPANAAAGESGNACRLRAIFIFRRTSATSKDRNCNVLNSRTLRKLLRGICHDVAAMVYRHWVLCGNPNYRMGDCRCSLVSAAMRDCLNVVHDLFEQRNLGALIE